MIQIGMVGVSPGNGHPYSFSSIINGYDPDGLAHAGWDVIYNYVRERDRSEVGFDDAAVTHVWTQDPDETKRLQAACMIPHSVDSVGDFVSAGVDAVIIARDDPETHASMAMPLLEAGLSVFVDKPLTLDAAELDGFRPYLERGKLMSCSGLRYARELDGPRANLDRYGTLRLIRGAVINGWDKYAIHLLEAVSEMLPGRVATVTPLPSHHASVALTWTSGVLFQLDALGAVPKTFQVDIFGSDARSTHEIADNFSAFRRTLYRFLTMVRTGESPIDPEETTHILDVIRAGKHALETGESVPIGSVAA